MQVDMIIKGGRVIDPFRNIDEIRDVAIHGGRIVEVSEGMEAKQIIDGKGKWVLPGLIDFHLHFFWGGTDIGVPVDVAMPAAGVTTAVDAGSAGFSTFESFVPQLIGSVTRTAAFLNVCPVGLGTMKFHEAVDPKYFDLERSAELFAKYPKQLLGLKVRQSKEIVEELGLEPLKATLKMAEKIGVPVAVHVTNPPENAGAIAELLRPNDIFCHVFHGTGNDIAPNGKVEPQIWQARERGVIFDGANGGNHFVFDTAEVALKEGFMPDIISTDLTVKTMFLPPVGGLPMVMAKYLTLGMPLMEVVRTVTENPARAMNLLGEIGTLQPGAVADVTILEPVEQKMTFMDTRKQIRQGNLALLPKETIRQGRIVFRTLDF